MRINGIDGIVACVDIAVPAVQCERVVDRVALRPAAAVGVVVALTGFVEAGLGVVPVAGEADRQRRVAAGEGADELAVGFPTTKSRRSCLTNLSFRRLQFAIDVCSYGVYEIPTAAPVAPLRERWTCGNRYQ